MLLLFSNTAGFSFKVGSTKCPVIVAHCALAQSATVLVVGEDFSIVIATLDSEVATKKRLKIKLKFWRLKDKESAHSREYTKIASCKSNKCHLIAEHSSLACA